MSHAKLFKMRIFATIITRRETEKHATMPFHAKKSKKKNIFYTEIRGKSRHL